MLAEAKETSLKILRAKLKRIKMVYKNVKKIKKIEFLSFKQKKWTQFCKKMRYFQNQMEMNNILANNFSIKRRYIDFSDMVNEFEQKFLKIG